MMKLKQSKNYKYNVKKVMRKVKKKLGIRISGGICSFRYEWICTK